MTVGQHSIMLQCFHGKPEEDEGVDQGVDAVTPENLCVEAFGILSDFVELWKPEHTFLSAGPLKDSQCERW